MHLFRNRRSISLGRPLLQWWSKRTPWAAVYFELRMTGTPTLMWREWLRSFGKYRSLAFVSPSVTRLDTAGTNVPRWIIRSKNGNSRRLATPGRCPGAGRATRSLGIPGAKVWAG